MYQHIDLGDTIFARNRRLIQLINEGKVTLGGYNKAKIYGTLNCPSGKRMNIKNRVFFTNQQEALAAGYRPCGNCMRKAYKRWKRQAETAKT